MCVMTILIGAAQCLDFMHEHMLQQHLPAVYIYTRLVSHRITSPALTLRPALVILCYRLTLQSRTTICIPYVAGHVMTLCDD